MKTSFLVILFLVLFYSCKKDSNQEVKFYDAYFPLDLGSWIQYSVHEINYSDIGYDTLDYDLKEILKETFLDDQGRLSYRVERYWRFSKNDPWEIKDVWVANKSTTTAERVEENERYIKMVFPVSISQYWNGNVYNSMKEWGYSYDSLHFPREINQLTFDSTVKVIQRDNINAVEFEQAEEIYAMNIGMIYKKLIDYDVNYTIKSGIEQEMKITAYGK
ncbi:MAG: hypothetical protein R3255_10625 [Candidatus Lokiarchaeia archaeon]|nr:hypothetical protein [Candidatus Lokiarchaeia archaeon]